MGDMIIPIFISSAPQEPDRCPQCKKIEDTSVVCNHCGYKYPEEEETPWGWKKSLLVTLAVVIGFWAFVTIVVWMVADAGDLGLPRHSADWFDQSRKVTLVEVLKAQWTLIKSIGPSLKEFFTDLSKRIK